MPPRHRGFEHWVAVCYSGGVMIQPPPPPFITAQCLSDAGVPVRHGFFGRQGGVSAGLYDSLNVALGSGDSAVAVTENRRRVVGALGGEQGDSGDNADSPLVTLYQTHSPDVVVVNSANPADCPDFAHQDRPRGDALITQSPGLVIGVLTADCLPLLLYAPDIAAVAAVHAGWRGTVAGVVPATLQRLKAMGADLSRLRAAAGPHLQAASFQVGQDLREQFLAINPAFEAHFSPWSLPNHSVAVPPESDKWRFNLSAVVRDQLAAAGVPAMELLPQDTYGDEGDWFSFRRATHREESDYGRQVAAIALA
ncbi:MAG: laccase domain-containing protein [Alphaproteobacteria bacterium]|nr:laccase domain-containing protein [Alphaproteobacteria bacterium]